MPNTATKSPQRKLQEGQAIVLIALLILVLFAMLGLAIDSGRSYVDRRDQQAAVDAAALAAGDWYANYVDLAGKTIPQSVQLYQDDLRLYSGFSFVSHQTTPVGVGGRLTQDEYKYGGPAGYSLTIDAINTQFNGYQFTYKSLHNLPLSFMQIFGGPAQVAIGATATSIVGNQRQTPALLTLSSSSCATNLKGSATLTILGDTYTNGSACLDANLHEAGNCYAVDPNSNCSVATYYCYNSSPGFRPYPPGALGCNGGDTIGQAIVPAPSLPDPGYLANSAGAYLSGQSYNQNNRGTWTEMLPGQYGTFHLTGGSASCAFLDPGVYTWNGGYASDASGSLVSNEFKSPDEENYLAPGTPALADPQFWNMNGTSCAGHFIPTIAIASGFGIKHGGLGPLNWGIELTSVRWDTFSDPSGVVGGPDPCIVSPGCRRESAPSACQEAITDDSKDQVIDISMTQNAPGAQYYNVYINPNGCDGNPNNFSFVNRFLAPGWSDAGGPPANPGGTYPSGGTGIVLINGTGGYPCGAAGHSVCKITAASLLPNVLCYAQSRTVRCQPPDDEFQPQCFSNCPPPLGLLSQENAPMQLEYFPYTGGDVANENYCQLAPVSPFGDPTAPCATAKITPGAVQFYFPAGSCMSQNAQGATYVFSGEQYNWIVIYSPGPAQAPTPSNTCSDSMNGGASTQYIGTIYTPAADWSINGGDRSPLAGQVICSTASVSGAGAVGIDFNPNYSPAPPAARLIN